MDKHFTIILLIFIFVLFSPDICLLIENFETKNALEKTRTEQLNVKNHLLQICSKSPKTGSYHDGYCNIGEYDKGEKTICAKMNNGFLDFIKGEGNDLSTPNKTNNFPGLKSGDKWCLSSIDWIKAHNHDKKIVPKVKIDATNIKTLYYIEEEILDENKLIEY